MHYNDWDYPVTYSFGTYSLIIGFVLAVIAIVMQVREVMDDRRFTNEHEVK
ncbi:hypothetical protein QTG56_23575 (plasmid) [Rossellomorea sp. AcN35-11]|nr:hypothetical protein [Rossellomorea aquimaris]WJV32345.1 hypothetical protein QTG56_23575 [Rossellomorea sp. AcN35-11]